MLLRVGLGCLCFRLRALARCFELVLGGLGCLLGCLLFVGCGVFDLLLGGREVGVGGVDLCRECLVGGLDCGDRGAVFVGVLVDLCL